eukprot:GHVS01085432.1.p1 GENE.GHVS01085432.1~~GHVS01085432.1.p1  ORF type:complete len:553 (+),score=81.60 GHVS01085432.1:42-1700(+)
MLHSLYLLNSSGGLIYQRQFASPPSSHVMVCQPLLDLLSAEPPADPQTIPPLLPLHLPLSAPFSFFASPSSTTRNPVADEVHSSSSIASSHLPSGLSEGVLQQASKPAGGGRGTGVLFQMWKNGLFYVAVVDVEVNPLAVMQLLETVESELKRYLGNNIEEQTIRDNFSTLHNLLEEMFDSGLPAITDANILSHFIAPTSFIAKALEQVTRPTSRLLSSFTSSPKSSAGSSAVAGLVGGVLTSIVEGVKTGAASAADEPPGETIGGGSGKGMGSGISGCGSDIWWRTGSASYSSNEVYVDVVESLWCSIIGSSGEVVESSITGEMFVSSKLSDMPELILYLQDPELLAEASFHPSVRLGRFNADRIISFIPPDGGSTLASYWLPDCALKPPVKLRSELSFPTGAGQSGSICLIVSAQAVLSRTGGGGANTAPIEDVQVRMELPEFIGGATLMSSLGSAKFDIKQKELIWNIGTLAPGDHRVEGLLTFEADENKQEDAVCPSEARCTAEVSFTIKGWAMSGIRVDTLDVSGVSYSPYKGCRYTTVAGKVEYRL